MHTASQVLGTAVRALTDPASLSKDASVSNEHLQEIALEAQVNSLFDGSSDSDSECVERSVVLAPGNTKDQQNEQPKAGCSSGTSSLCPLDLIDEDIDHNQNDSEEEQIDEVGSPSPASSALKRFGSAPNQQIRGNLEQALEPRLRASHSPPLAHSTTTTVVPLPTDFFDVFEGDNSVLWPVAHRHHPEHILQQ